jgi:predicted nucleic acid-binding protein
VALSVLLDTSAYSELKRGNPLVASIVRAAEELLVSAVVIGELLYGFRRGSRFQRNQRELEAFLGRPRVRFVPVTRVTADRYSRIASALRASGTPIPSNDIWIAAHAMETGAELVSFDAHFEHVAGIAWIRPA